MTAELAKPFEVDVEHLRTAVLRQLLRDRDGDLCSICGELMDFTLPRGDPQAPSLEHVRPKAAGGRTVMGNLRLAHASPCNHDKGSYWAGRYWSRPGNPYGHGKHRRRAATATTLASTQREH
jgi:5-methylcytosine-specific restriction endonuclease McrA